MSVITVQLSRPFACVFTVYLVDIWNMIEAFREVGLSSLDPAAEVPLNILEMLLTCVFCSLNKRLPNSAQIDVADSVQSLFSFLVCAYDVCVPRRLHFVFKAERITLRIVWFQLVVVNDSLLTGLPVTNGMTSSRTVCKSLHTTAVFQMDLGWPVPECRSDVEGHVSKGSAMPSSLVPRGQGSSGCKSLFNVQPRLRPSSQGGKVPVVAKVFLTFSHAFVLHPKGARFQWLQSFLTFLTTSIQFHLERPNSAE